MKKDKPLIVKKINYTEKVDKLKDKSFDTDDKINAGIEEAENLAVNVQSVKNSLKSSKKKTIITSIVVACSSIVAAIGGMAGFISLISDKTPYATVVAAGAIGVAAAISSGVVGAIVSGKMKSKIKKAEKIVEETNTLSRDLQKAKTDRSLKTKVITLDAAPVKAETKDKEPVYALQIKITNPKKPGLQSETVYSYSPEGPQCLFNFIRGLKEIAEGKNEEFNTVLNDHRKEGADMQIIVTNPDNHSKIKTLRPKKKVSTVYKDLGEVAVQLRKSILTYSEVR